MSGYLDQSEGELVRINVRVTSSPSFREIDSSNVQAGEGVSSEEPKDSEQE